MLATQIASTLFCRSREGWWPRQAICNRKRCTALKCAGGAVRTLGMLTCKPTPIGPFVRRMLLHSDSYVVESVTGPLVGLRGTPRDPAWKGLTAPAR